MITLIKSITAQISLSFFFVFDCWESFARKNQKHQLSLTTPDDVIL